MTEQEFFEQADREVAKLEQCRHNFMTDTEPVTWADIPKLLKIGEMLRNEDTSLNIYELYKHPEARGKLFAQIVEAAFMVAGREPSQGERLNLGQYLEGQFTATMNKLISQTDRQVLGELVDILDMDEETKSRFIRDMAVSGLLAREE